MYVCTLHECLMLMVEKKILGPLELELWMAMSCRAGVENLIWVLCYKCS